MYRRSFITASTAGLVTTVSGCLSATRSESKLGSVRVSDVTLDEQDGGGVYSGGELSEYVIHVEDPRSGIDNIIDKKYVVEKPNGSRTDETQLATQILYLWLVKSKFNAWLEEPSGYVFEGSYGDGDPWTDRTPFSEFLDNLRTLVMVAEQIDATSPTRILESMDIVDSSTRGSLAELSDEIGESGEILDLLESLADLLTEFSITSDIGDSVETVVDGIRELPNAFEEIQQRTVAVLTGPVPGWRNDNMPRIERPPLIDVLETFERLNNNEPVDWLYVGKVLLPDSLGNAMEEPDSRAGMLWSHHGIGGTLGSYEHGFSNLDAALSDISSGLETIADEVREITLGTGAKLEGVLRKTASIIDGLRQPINRYMGIIFSLRNTLQYQFGRVANELLPLDALRDVGSENINARELQYA